MSIIKSFSAGNGDMFYINHNSDNFTTIDCCYEDDDSRDENFGEIKTLASNKGVSRFISTHPDEDHILGLLDFCSTVGIVNFYCVKNEATKTDESESFKKYCELRDSDKAFYLHKGCSRKWMNISDDERGCAGIHCLWPITDNDDFKAELKLAKEGTAFNNISPIITYSVNNGVKAIWLGDMENVFLEKIKGKVDWPEVDILFAPHHGRSSGKISSDVLAKMKPQIVVIGKAPSKNLDYYSGYNTITQNSAGSIVFDCDDSRVHIYVSNESYSVAFLDNDKKINTSHGHYIGSFTPKRAK